MKLLVVGTPSSVHTAKFCALLAELGEDVRVFNVEQHDAADEHLGDLPVYVSTRDLKAQGTRRIAWASRTPVSAFAAAAFGETARRRAERLETRLLKWRRRNAATPLLGPLVRDRRSAVDGLLGAIVDWRPDLVISLKMQDEGYTVAAAKRARERRFPPWLHFNWGTDIAYFGVDPYHRPTHEPRIREVLALCDAHIADCERDVAWARELGFRGQSLGACLATGGFDLGALAAIRAAAPTERRTILVKGRNWPTRDSGMTPISVGLKSIEALDLARDAIRAKGLAIKVILATPDVAEAAEALARRSGLDIEVLKRLSYRDLLAQFAAARFTLSSTLVDGTPLFLAETMAMGSTPLHSDLASIREWVVDGENGLLFPPEDADATARQIERACRDDAFIAAAAARNLEIAAARMNRAEIGPRLRAQLAGLVAAHGDGAAAREAGR